MAQKMTKIDEMRLNLAAEVGEGKVWGLLLLDRARSRFFAPSKLAF